MYYYFTRLMQLSANAYHIAQHLVFSELVAKFQEIEHTLALFVHKLGAIL